MWQANIVVRLIEGELVPQAFLAFAQGHHTPPDGGDMLADREIDALNEGGVDLPTLWGQHVCDASQRTEHHAMTHLNEPSAPVFLDDLRIEELWHGHPAGLRHGTCGLTTRRLHPLAKVGQQRRGV